MKMSKSMIVVISIIFLVIIGSLIYFFSNKKEKYGVLRYIKNNDIITNAKIDKNGLIDVNPEIDDDNSLPFLNYQHTGSVKYNYKNYLKNHRQRNNSVRNQHYLI